MTDREKVLKGLECCVGPDKYRADCWACPYEGTKDMCNIEIMLGDIYELLKEQTAIIEQYHKADSFLEAHGWKWEGR